VFATPHITQTPNAPPAHAVAASHTQAHTTLYTRAPIASLTHVPIATLELAPTASPTLAPTTSRATPRRQGSHRLPFIDILPYHL